MKLQHIFTLALVYLSALGYAQSGIGNDTQQKTNFIALPTTANAYALDKVGKLPVDLFRGKANINIPVYTVQADGVSIPISLAYNTGGIKLNEVAGTTGLGWALSIPNTITHNIVDKDDKYIPMFSKNYNEAMANLKDIGGNDNEARLIVEGIFQGNYDTRPDIFNYNLPTASGSFIVSNGLGHTIPHDDIKIEVSSEIKKIKITDKGGNIFYLSPKSFSAYDTGESGMGATNEPLYALDSIRTAHNRKIEFKYNKVLSYLEKSINERVNVLLSQRPTGSFEPSLPLPPYERFEGSAANTEWLLTQIIFPEGEVLFQYSDDEGLNTITGELYRKDLNTQNGVALRKILVKNKAGHAIKSLSLNYSYFTSARPNKNYQDYRLKLTEVFDNLQQNSHNFAYNEETPLPARNSNNDDYWGYINNTASTEMTPNIPRAIKSQYVSSGFTMPNDKTRDRETHTSYAQLGVLNKVTYPTKGSKKLYYESNIISQTKTVIGTEGWSAGRIVSKYPGDDVIDDTSDMNANIIIPQSEVAGKQNVKVTVSFGNSCQNNRDDVGTIHETSCLPSGQHNGIQLGSQGKPRVTVLQGGQFSPGVPISLSLMRVGNCQCSFSVRVDYDKISSYNVETPVGGLRIKKIEDVNENNTTNVFNYDYQYFDKTTNTSKGSGSLNLPFQYASLRKKYVRRIDPSTGQESGDPYLERNLVVSNSGSSYNSYASSDIVTYKQVTESNELGKTINEFTQEKDNDQLYSYTHSKYNNWKNGLLKKSILLNKANDTVRTQTNTFAFNSLKNPLSGYVTGQPKNIAFAFDADITQYMAQMHGGPSPEYIDVYYVDKKHIPIESGKIEATETVTSEFFQNKKIESKTVNSYYNTDINKPINLKNTISTLPSGESIKTEYQYAHEKGNQLMISKNIIDTPLETTISNTVNGAAKTVSRNEGIYPVSQGEADSKTSGLVLPLSALSYNVENGNASTETTYDRYDNKGNLLQYTTKDGVPVSIIWGYHQTLPIAKIEGIRFQDIPQSLIVTVTDLSNTDATRETQDTETDLVSALDIFRTQSALSGYQITTYTYDTLIGVRSITPPSGIREIYLYDSANRLEKVVDANGKVLKEYQYHYKN